MKNPNLKRVFFARSESEAVCGCVLSCPLLLGAAQRIVCAELVRSEERMLSWCTAPKRSEERTHCPSHLRKRSASHGASFAPQDERSYHESPYFATTLCFPSPGLGERIYVEGGKDPSGRTKMRGIL